jgi:hypothetical protein
MEAAVAARAELPELEARGTAAAARVNTIDDEQSTL